MTTPTAQGDKKGFGEVVALSGLGAIFKPALQNLSSQEQEELFTELATAVKTGGIDDHDGRGGGWIRLPPKLQGIVNKHRGTPGHQDSLRISPVSRAMILEELDDKKKEKKEEKEQKMPITGLISIS